MAKQAKRPLWASILRGDRSESAKSTKLTIPTLLFAGNASKEFWLLGHRQQRPKMEKHTTYTIFQKTVKNSAQIWKIFRCVCLLSWKIDDLITFCVNVGREFVQLFRLLRKSIYLKNLSVMNSIEEKCFGIPKMENDHKKQGPMKLRNRVTLIMDSKTTTILSRRKRTPFTSVENKSSITACFRTSSHITTERADGNSRDGLLYAKYPNFPFYHLSLSFVGFSRNSSGSAQQQLKTTWFTLCIPS